MLKQEDFLARIERFLKRHGISASAFGSESIGDPSLVMDMRNDGRFPHMRTLQKIEDFMKKYKKENVNA